MSFLTQPDRDRFPRPAERFQWRWNRVFLVGQVLFGIPFLLHSLMVGGFAGTNWSLRLAGVAAFLGGFVLPAASYLAGRLGAGRAGVTGMLARGATAIGFLMASIGVAQGLALDSPSARLVGAAVAVCGGAVMLTALADGAAAPGSSPGFGAAIYGTPAAVIVLFLLVPGYWHTPERSYFLGVRSDVRNLASAQELYRHDSGTYASDLGELNLSPSAGVTLTLTRTADGWVARGSHGQIDVECGVYEGSTPAPPAERAGEVTCQPTWREFLAARQERTRTLETGGILGALLLLFGLGLHAVLRKNGPGDSGPPPSATGAGRSGHESQGVRP